MNGTIETAEEFAWVLSQMLGVAFVVALIVIVFLNVVMGILCKNIAAEKGYKGHFWIGFFFGVIGLFYVAFLPDKKMQKYLRMCSMKMQIMDAQIDDLQDKLNR